MSTVAKAGITLTSISDAYSVSLAPSMCVIHADFDGSNPVLINAYTTISVYCGEAKVPFGVISVRPSSDDIQLACVKLNDNTYRLSITNLASHIIDGHVVLTLLTANNVELLADFQFTVERESTMLDWIQAWENNKTTIGSTSIITPKLFVGKKITGSYDSLTEVPGLTGVYIGPSENDSCGLYGYKDSIEIFHLDETGGKIGGWSINELGLFSSDNNMRILASGSIIALQDGETLWQICEDGNVAFAKGNVLMYADGSAEFTGKITSESGNIGGWNIAPGKMVSSSIGLSAASNYIAIANIENVESSDNPLSDNHFNWVKQYGGVAMYYVSSQDYGFIAHNNSGKLVFSSGKVNKIAGWNFEENAFYLGEKNNNVGEYTSAAGWLTIGTNGLRGYSWYIDINGNVSLAHGMVEFTNTGSHISGWTLGSNKLSTKRVAILSGESGSGLYMTHSVNGNFDIANYSSMINFIRLSGGLYLNVSETSANFNAYNNQGQRLFSLTGDGINYIAGWCFDNDVLYTGTKCTSGYTANASDITIGATGIRGYKWRLESDGSGALAGGNITWASDGSGSLANGKISWKENGDVIFSDTVKISFANLGETIIDSNDIFTGHINADNIIAGTLRAIDIYAANIQQEENKWELKKDGSGQLASNGFRWSTEGDIFCNKGTFNNVTIYGNGNITGFMRKGIAIITPDNIRDYTIDNGESIDVYGYAKIDIMKTGSFILFENDANNMGFSGMSVRIELPHCEYVSNEGSAAFDSALLYVGSNIIISFNADNLSVTIKGITADNGANGCFTSGAVQQTLTNSKGHMVFATCLGLPQGTRINTNSGGFSVMWFFSMTNFGNAEFDVNDNWSGDNGGLIAKPPVITI